MRRTTAVTLALLGGYLLALAANRSLVVVRGRSMEPTLFAGDVLVTIPAHPALLRAGRVVVVEDPAAAGHLVVKRVRRVGGAGVEVRGDAADRSTDSAVWGRVPARAVRRVAVARWPDLRTPLTRAT